ncbi:ABC transporter ATP-binding protein [Endozoicomonas sp. SCSIO W0465]|uniref:ABC transporter ATP-binding protein n=1 Tax=Endozoicomonas sp. SCSIO W0465 TaxID=2918516 RepID=UPI002074B858|nr:dipeptide ABC transporter ATP-binding protein [Endozoicomonas sp. SCSIO W0465]USE36097.1 dipeptide ABC transporter ATP-binding protein [Endozoicomonas sp. SCSIO W0465]
MSEAILKVDDLKVHFPVDVGNFFSKKATLKAVDGVSFELHEGETLSVVGESGCGKSTLGRAVLQLLHNTEGQVVWMGENITGHSVKAMQPLRREMQIIFQDPLASLDPRMTIGEIIAEPLVTHNPQMPKDQVKNRVREMMDIVGLLPRMINRYPHEFSGGQCQRIGIARAMILQPKVIVCDEPVSALDVSIQAQIINLLGELQKKFGLSLLFISHDLSIVRHISHRVMVLYLGNVMELAEKDELYNAPRHPYTQALISAVPVPDPDKEAHKKRIVLKGDLPSPINPPSGCVFRTRCWYADHQCEQEKPPLTTLGGPTAKGKHQVACHKQAEINQN